MTAIGAQGPFGVLELKSWFPPTAADRRTITGWTAVDPWGHSARRTKSTVGAFQEGGDAPALAFCLMNQTGFPDRATRSLAKP
jgi:hypothetical protein